MNWTKASAVAEIVSSAAILATLAYLAIQTQQNTAAIQGNSRLISTSVSQNFLFTQMENPEMWARVHEEDLTDEEKVYFAAWLVAFFSMRETDWLNYRNGILDEVAWQGSIAAITQVLSQQNFRIWWRNFSADAYNPEFRAIVDGIIAQSPPRTDNNILRQWE